MLQHNVFFNFASHYLATHTAPKDFAVDDAVLQQFKDFLKTSNIDYNDKEIAPVKDWLTSSIKAAIVTSQFGQMEGLKVRALWDPQIAKALTFMPEALALEQMTRPGAPAKTTVAQR